MRKLLEWFQQKYKSSDTGMVLRSVAYFDDAKDQVEPEILDGTTSEAVKAAISRALRDCL